MSETGELRKDYILDRWVIISGNRANRPVEYAKPESSEHTSSCHFCPGNEDSTPTEIGRSPDTGKWKVRWFENKFPAMKPEGKYQVKTDNSFYTFSQPYGYAWILVETPDKRQLAELTIDEITLILKTYVRIIQDLEKKENVAYVGICKNSGREAGASIIHSHSQIITLPFMPNALKDEMNAMRKYSSCPYCKIISTEKQSARRAYENEEWVAFCPYASRYNYELWFFPKEHVNRMEKTDIRKLADILKQALLKLHKIGASYNFSLHYFKDSDMHFHIELQPRLARWGALEQSTDVIINTVPPEKAAEFYRE